MTESRNWDKELADIDRAMAKGGAAPTGSPPARIAAGTPAGVGGGSLPSVRKRDLVGVWLKVLLGAAGAAALAIWPYHKGCGTGLYLFLALVTVIAMAGVWVMHAAWRHRRPAAHIAGLLILLSALVLVAAEVLPRVGYAAHVLSWTCHLPAS